MLEFYDIENAVAAAEAELQRVENKAKHIGRLACRPMILRNMSGGQLFEIKRQLRDFNMITFKWKD